MDDGGVPADETALHLTPTDREYLAIALARLAKDYDKKPELAPHAEFCRALEGRVKRTPITRSGVPAEDHERIATAIIEAMKSGDRPAFEAAISDLYELSLRYEPDPERWLAETSAKIISDAQRTAAQSTVFMVQAKLAGLVRDPKVESPHEVFQQLSTFIEAGRVHLQDGPVEALWSTDPHLLELQAKAQAESKV